MRRQHQSSLEPSPIGAIVSLGALGALQGGWAAFIIWLLVVRHDDHWLVVLAMLLSGGFMIAGAFMIFHGIYLMYRLLPAIDEHLDPHLAAYTRQRGDPMYWRIHRVLLYSGSLAWRWAHRRMEYRDYDFQNLPLSLRLPLLTEYYALVGSVLCLIMGATLMKLSQEMGLT